MMNMNIREHMKVVGSDGRSIGSMDKVEGDKGILRSVQRASDAVGDVARNANGLGKELEETLRDIQEAAASIRRLADALERDPDMLLKGRAKAASR